MLIKEQNQTNKGSGVFISLTVHAVLIALLFLAITEKRLTDEFFTRRNHDQTPASVHYTADEPKKDTPQQPAEESSVPKAIDDKKKQPTLNQPFVVPAPVVFYGNQALMNKPVPVSGHSDGKSAFEHSPSALPTPPAPAIAPERTPSISAPQLLAPHPKPADNQTLQEAHQEQEAIETKELQDIITSPFDASVAENQNKFEETAPQPKREAQQGEGILVAALEKSSRKQTPEEAPHPSQEMNTAPRKKRQQSQQAKKLTLADLFKNASSTIASFAQDGLPSARKAGTEGGDDQGSGHQITIKEGDMKYYTLWAKFLNHLNQAARFNRRGKEGMIHTWMNNKEIQYILQCGITVDMQGKILDIEIMVSSGCSGFDKLCVSDIRSAVPYPPLPESLGKKTARFEVNVYP
jgi:hypothetical protein